ncbi:hypothetical protein C7S20_07160 [Christiangramia fulva]|uniref:Arm DNA-binding domain-containing protein n=1 Tax=Christiangramia fulva TaxID=2126553 RepID=A0A2R3Z496_9FLAO|nr:Arm DNA-binding domain-containing protein [Christiangramia fulva]AVR45064.1 hypothetical protein C7S20_07160 [Christiangramia fulva]
MKTIFLVHKNKANKKGITSISCRITVDKTRKEFSTGLFINPDYWSKEKQ